MECKYACCFGHSVVQWQKYRIVAEADINCHISGYISDAVMLVSICMLQLAQMTVMLHLIANGVVILRLKML